MRAPRALHRAGLVLAVACSVAACGRGAGAGPEWLASEARQVDVELVLDGARARSREIGPAGGTVTATADDGTRFQLRIPAGALLAPERITMTPVREVRGLPFARGDFMTVHLEPNGLRLQQPAVLTIRPQRAVPVAEQVAFAYFGQGQDAHLYPLGPDTARIEMRLQHFSGYGFGQAAPNDPGRLALQHAVRVEARLESQVAELAARARRNEIDMGAFADGLIAVYVQYYDEVVAGLLKTAETDDRMATCAVQCAAAWMRAVQLSGAAGPDATEPVKAAQERHDAAHAAMIRVLDNAYTQGFERFRTACRQDHDVRGVKRLIALERQAQLSGMDSTRFKDLNAAVEECMRFEVEFRSVFETRTPTGGSHHDVVARLRTTVPLYPAPLDSATLQYAGFAVSGDPTADLFGSGSDVFGLIADSRGDLSAVGTKPGTFVLHRLALQVDNPKDSVLVTNCQGKDEKAQAEVVDTLLVTFSPGVPREVVRFTPKNSRARLPTAVAALARAFGDDEAAAQAEAASRLTPSVAEEQYWAKHWARAHRHHAVGGGGDDDEVGAMYTLKAAIVEPGVWRADTSWTEPPAMGFSSAERSYLTIRHVP